MTRLWAAGLCAGLLVTWTGATALNTPARAQTAVFAAPVALKTSSSPPLPAHSTRLGAVPAGTDLRVEVSLKLPHPGAVTSFIAALSDRSSPEFHRFLRPGQFGPLFGPSLSEVAAVEAALSSEGLRPGKVSSDRLLIPVTASAGALDRAFHVSLLRYKLPGGRVAFTTLSPPSISATVASDVEGVTGLNNLVLPHNALVTATPAGAAVAGQPRTGVPRTPDPAPCASATEVANQSGGFTADQLASYYAMTPLYDLGDFGQGVHVAIAEFEPDLPSDIEAYQACYGTNATVNYFAINGGAAAGSGTDAEAAMDIEDVIGLAPQAVIDVYQAPSSSNDDVLATYSAIVDNDADPVVTTSWGECEPDQDASDSSFRASEQTLFQQAATQGQTVFAAAGDAGSTDCYGDKDSTNQQGLYVDDPASQPYVVGVGGTSIRGSSETVWNDATGAGGGGVSSSWCMPSYQDHASIVGLISDNSEYANLVPGTSCAAGSYMRQVPDVSADADPDTGYVIFWNGAWSGTYAGTSAAAPLWAAAAALIDASPFCAYYGSGDAGVRPEGLYDIAALGASYYGLALNDITSGDNDDDASSYSGGLYPATVGYDMASGLGSPHLAYFDNYTPGLAAQMCLEYRTQLVVTEITKVTPDVGPSGQPTSVTVSGSGFLPIAGADRLEVGASSVTVSCLTTTSCTGVLPPSAPGTLDLVMSVEDATTSPESAADEFTFAGPPDITKLDPTSGPTLGGSKLTIWGNNFEGDVSVDVGGKPARAVNVVSTSEIVIDTPAGSGSSDVAVTTVAGSTPSVPADEYTFLAPPSITKITPAVGPTSGGTKVTIRGRNFHGDVRVRFGDKIAKVVHVISSSQISVSVPAGSGAAYVTVSTVGGTSRTDPTTKFTFMPVPLVKRISPASGPATGREKVTILGSNFVGTVTVRFGNRLASDVRVLSRTKLTAETPAGSGTVNVTVSAVGGGSRDQAAAKYRYRARPA
jgi:hypothetical protein